MSAGLRPAAVVAAAAVAVVVAVSAAATTSVATVSVPFIVNGLPGGCAACGCAVPDTQSRVFPLPTLLHPAPCGVAPLPPAVAAPNTRAPAAGAGAGPSEGDHPGRTAHPIGSFRYRAPPDGAEAAALPTTERTNLARRSAVRVATARVWSAYVAGAAGFDELRPLSGGGVDNLGGMVATAVDSLSTLLLMGLDAEAAAARTLIDTHLSVDRVGEVSVFETTIRVLGGLVSAYHMVGDALYLKRAVALATALAPAFSAPSGLPWPRCTLNATAPDGSGGSCRGHPTSGESALLAEVGSIQLELRALAHAAPSPLTARLREAAEGAIAVVRRVASTAGYGGLVPSHLSLADGRPTTNLLTSGAPADSYYEYLVKAWVQGGRTEAPYLAMWQRVLRGVLAGDVAYTSRKGDTLLRTVLTVAAGREGLTADDVSFLPRMDHFSCFFPGAILSALDTAADADERATWMELATRLTETCHNMYARSPSGLAGEQVRLAGADESWRMAGGYHLRPEAIEAYFHMYRATRDPIYREWTWEAFTALERHCTTPSGAVAALKVARSGRPVQDDLMHSFVLSETFKYAYLVFEEPDVLGEGWVFNTEAHPLLVTPALGEGGGLLPPMEGGTGPTAAPKDEL